MESSLKPRDVTSKAASRELQGIADDVQTAVPILLTFATGSKLITEPVRPGPRSSARALCGRAAASAPPPRARRYSGCRTADP